MIKGLKEGFCMQKSCSRTSPKTILNCFILNTVISKAKHLRNVLGRILEPDFYVQNKSFRLIQNQFEIIQNLQRQKFLEYRIIVQQILFFLKKNSHLHVFSPTQMKKKSQLHVFSPTYIKDMFQLHVYSVDTLIWSPRVLRVSHHFWAHQY